MFDIPPGVVVLDANAFWRLESPEVQERVIASCRAADLLFRPTAVNLFEIVQTPNPTRRSRLLGAMAAMSQERPVLPFPLECLRRVGEMISRGEETFEHVPSDFEWMLYEPDRITDDHVRKAETLLNTQQAEFDGRHKRARRHVRDLLKSKQLGDPWGSSVRFLEEQWTTRSHLDTYIERYWSQLKLAGPAPVDAVLASEAWRLSFEGLGATVYERAVASQLAQPAHANDIAQLVYLAGNPKRVLVTDDRGLQRVASDVLLGRYPGARVMSVSEFVGQAC